MTPRFLTFVETPFGFRTDVEMIIAGALICALFLVVIAWLAR